MITSVLNSITLVLTEKKAYSWDLKCSYILILSFLFNQIHCINLWALCSVIIPMHGPEVYLAGTISSLILQVRIYSMPTYKLGPEIIVLVCNHVHIANTFWGVSVIITWFYSKSWSTTPLVAPSSSFFLHSPLVCQDLCSKLSQRCKLQFGNFYSKFSGAESPVATGQ